MKHVLTVLLFLLIFAQDPLLAMPFSDAPEDSQLGIADLTRKTTPGSPMTFTLMSNGKLDMVILDPGFPTNLSKAEKARRIREELFPKMLQAAAKGVQPAVWQIGYIYQYGWWGIERDLDKAEAALRLAPDHERGISMWRLGQIHTRETKNYSKGYDLFAEAIDAGCRKAVPDAIWLARAYIYGWLHLKKDNQKAEYLLQKVGALVPDNAHYLVAMGALRFEHFRFAEAYEFVTRAAPKLRDNAMDYRFALGIRVLCSLRIGKFAEISPLDSLEMILGPVKGETGWMFWAAFTVFLSALAATVLWAYGTRKKRAGLWLSGTWIIIVIFGTGLGFILPLPIHNKMGVFWGAVLIACACLISARFSGGARYFGVGRIVPGAMELFRTALFPLALLAGLFAIESGYDFLYKLIMGRSLDMSLVAGMFHCATINDLVIVVLIAGIIIPFYEEVIFRGFLFDSLDRRWGVGWALGVSSVVFGLLHELTYVPVIICMGLALGWLRLRSGDLRQSILLHCLNNTVAILVLNFPLLISPAKPG